MCYAIPGKVKAIRDKEVVVDYYGEEKTALNELVGLEVGDYVYAQGGYIIERVSPVEASNVLETWKDLFFELKGLDAQASGIDLGQFPDSFTKTTLQRVLDGGSLNDSDALALLRLGCFRTDLVSYRNHLRQKYHDTRVVCTVSSRSRISAAVIAVIVEYRRTIKILCAIAWTRERSWR